jgi:uncharacterized membrane protein YdjX (TVP38/TMEM64 family)
MARRFLNFASKKRTAFLYLAVLVVTSLLIFLLGQRISGEKITSFVKGVGVWAPLVYILLIVSTQIIAPLSGTPIIFAGYELFGDRLQLYDYFAVIISGIANFWIARRFGRDLVLKMVGKKEMGKVDSFVEDYGVKTLIFLRVFQGHLHDFISYAYGLTKMSFYPYFTITVLGRIPWLLFWQFFVFPRVDNVTEFTLWYLLTLVPLFIVSWLFLKYDRRKKWWFFG